jgi:hypothetical protein
LVESHLGNYRLRLMAGAQQASSRRFALKRVVVCSELISYVPKQPYLSQNVTRAVTCRDLGPPFSCVCTLVIVPNAAVPYVRFGVV